MQKQGGSSKANNRLNRGMTKRLSSMKDPQQVLEDMIREDRVRMIKECVESIRGLKQLCQVTKDRVRR